MKKQFLAAWNFDEPARRRHDENLLIPHFPFLIFSYTRLETICLFQIGKTFERFMPQPVCTISFRVQVKCSDIGIVSQKYANLFLLSGRKRDTVADMHLWDCFQSFSFAFCRRHVAQLTAPKIEQRPGWQIVSNSQASAQLHRHRQMVVTAMPWNVSLYPRLYRLFPAPVCVCVCWLHSNMAGTLLGGDSPGEEGQRGSLARGCQAHLCCALFKLLNLLDNLPRKWKLSTDAGKAATLSAFPLSLQPTENSI